MSAKNVLPYRVVCQVPYWAHQKCGFASYPWKTNKSVIALQKVYHRAINQKIYFLLFSAFWLPTFCDLYKIKKLMLKLNFFFIILVIDWYITGELCKNPPKKVGREDGTKRKGKILFGYRPHPSAQYDILASFCNLFT